MGHKKAVSHPAPDPPESEADETGRDMSNAKIARSYGELEVI